MFRIESCAKQRVCIDDRSEERASAQIRIEQRSDFIWLRAKLGNDVRHNSESIATKVFSQIRRKLEWNAMFENHVVTSVDTAWQDELRFSIWIFFEQFSFVNNHLLCYWPIIHNSISKISPKFQVISSHFFDGRSMSCSMKIVRSENISTPIYVKCDKMYRSKVCVQEFSYFVSGLDIQLEKSEYAKNSVAGGELWRVIYRFFQAIHTNLWLSG